MTPPDVLTPAFSTAAVAPASLVSNIEDAIEASLNAFNVVNVAGGDAVQIGIDTLAGLPLGLAAAASAIIYDPSSTADVLNFLIQSFVNPNQLPPVGIPQSVLYLFGQQVVVPLALLLPPALSTPLLNAFAGFGDLLSDGLALLPGNFYAGAAAVGAGLAALPPFLTPKLTDIKTIGEAIGTGIGGVKVPPNGAPAPGNIYPNGLGGWLGYAPTLLFATLSAAINDPTLTPGLLSYLVYSLLASPTNPDFPPPGGMTPFPVGSYSLFAATLGPLINALIVNLPAPIGTPNGIVATTTGFLGDAIETGLAFLPTPVNPYLNQPPTMLAAKMAPAIPPDTNPSDVLAAAKESRAYLEAAAEQLPAAVQQLALSIAKDPASAPVQVAAFGNSLVDTVQEVVVAPVTYAAIGTLPTKVRPVAVKVDAAANEVVDTVQDRVTKRVTPEPTEAKEAKTLAVKKAGKHQVGEGRVHVRDLAKKLKKKPAADAAE